MKKLELTQDVMKRLTFIHWSGRVRSHLMEAVPVC